MSDTDLLTFEEALQALVDTRAAIESLQDLAGEYERRVAATIPGKQVMVPGVGLVERYGGVRRTGWDHPRILSIVAARAADDMFDQETGEAKPMGVVAQQVAEKVAEAAGISYWRLSVLSQLGVDGDEFCSKEWGHPRIKVTVR